MPVFDTAEKLVNPDHFAEKLVGAMCEITFILKHYAIGPQTKANGNVVEANDVFSALVENVSILKNPPILPTSPYKARLAKRPHHRPQLPTRNEQVNAAAAFVPHPETEHRKTESTFETSLTRPSTSIHQTTAVSSISPVVNLPSTLTIPTTHVEYKTSADHQHPGDSPLNNQKSDETFSTNNANSLSIFTTSIKPQGIASTVKTVVIFF